MVIKTKTLSRYWSALSKKSAKELKIKNQKTVAPKKTKRMLKKMAKNLGNFHLTCNHFNTGDKIAVITRCCSDNA